MTDLSDADLLGQFVREHSEAAFTALVERHIGLVYSVALRHTGNPQQAQDITQAVFIILARKAAALGRKTVLPGWLHQAARLTAANFQRAELRRVRREQEAYMQSTLQDSAPDPLWRELSPLLDDALSRLGSGDRDALILRYFQNKSLPEVGAAMGLPERTAQKRVLRAVEKLRKFFSRRGVDSTADKITETISANSIQAVPAALAKTVAATALAKGATTSVTAVALAKATLVAMKIKMMMATTAAVVIIAGISAWLAGFHLFPQPAPPAPPSDRVPILLANSDFKDPAGNPALALQTGGDIQSVTFLNEIDPNVRRTTNSEPAGHLKSLVEINVDDSSTWYLNAVMGADHRQVVRYLVYSVTANSSLLGKRVRVSGWVKVNHVRQWAGGTLIVANANHGFAFDDTTSRPISGTADWQPMEFVTDIPKEPCIIYLAEKLYGNGEAWFDDFQIDLAPAGMPITDDRDWRFFGADPADYTESTDLDVTHNGRPSLCVAYIPTGKAPPAAKMYWGKSIRAADADKYKGHTVRMSIWIKTENVSDALVPAFHPRDGNGKILTHEQNDPRIRGTTDWTLHAFTCRIPEETDGINVGVNFAGSGKFWIDMSSIKYEIIK